MSSASRREQGPRQMDFSPAGSERTSSRWPQLAKQNRTAGEPGQGVKGQYSVRPFSEDAIWRSNVRLKGAIPNEFKSWEFCKEAAQFLYPERVTIADRQGTSEDQKFAAQLTQQKTNF